MVLEKSAEDVAILRRRLKQNTGDPNVEKYRFYGQHFPQLDEFLFKRYFPDVNIRGVFIECGANDGYAGSNCKFFEETLNWTGYNIEPTPATYLLLKERRPRSCNFNLALSDHCGELNFAITEPVEKNIAYHGAVNRVINAELLGGDFIVSGTEYRVSETVKVPCLTYKRFIEDNKIDFVDLFVLDTEGHEMAVINGMSDCKVLPAVMCVEDGWREGIRQKLADLGYVFDIEHFGNHCYVKKDLLGLFVLRGLNKKY